ncbi:MAG: hypothetical protein AAGF11_43610 [Myxococcota bacterium]
MASSTKNVEARGDRVNRAVKQLSDHKTVTKKGKFLIPRQVVCDGNAIEDRADKG